VKNTSFRSRHPADFHLGAFHDKLLQFGSLPLSIVEWLMLGNSTTVERVLR
jgi:uncharacterized protein (DUF885 family)